MSSATTDAQLFVHETGTGEARRLVYHLGVLRPQLGAGDRFFVLPEWPVDAGAPLSALLRRVQHLLDERSAPTSPADYLAGVGLDLHDQLVPRELSAALWQILERNASGAAPSLLLLSREALVPWELLMLRDPRSGEPGPYLVEAFALTRWIADATHAFELPLTNLGLVAPEGSRLPAAADERDFVLGLQGPQRTVTRVPARIEPLIEQLAQGRYDGWHFAGHGVTAGDDPGDWGLYLEGRDRLTHYALLHSAHGLGASRPLVFANACSSGRSARSLTRIGGIARSFLGLGAGAFIGPLWDVRDRPTATFAKAFYGNFLAGAPLGEAIRRSRLELRERAPEDPAWLAYTAFGHPLAHCGPPAAADRSAGSRRPLVLPGPTWRPERSPPGSLLRADNGVVPFHGREPEMDDLTRWAHSDPPLAVRLYTGPGGMGKTRLALEVCRRLEGSGWWTGFFPAGPLPNGAPAELVREVLDGAAAGRDPLLLVVDYAENRRQLLSPLLGELYRVERHRVRVLLLARAALDWWDELRAERGGVGELLSGPATTRHALPPLALTVEQRADSYRLAGTAFSERLGQPPPIALPDDLDAAHYERALLLHMSALAAVQGMPVREEGGILDFVLDRERRFWSDRATGRGLSRDLVIGIGRALAAITLGGGVADESGAVAVLQRLEIFADQPHSVLVDVARLLHECYPGSRWIEPLQPDLLGEHLVLRELERGAPELLGMVFDGGGDGGGE